MAKQNTMAVPFVAGIIERTLANGTKQVLIQTRVNVRPGSPTIYNGTFEFAAGQLDQGYENIYDALAREIQEETGMRLKCIINDSKTATFSPQGIDAVFGFRPYCCVQQLREGRPWIGFIFRCEVDEGEPKGQPGESKDVHWMNIDDFFKIYSSQPEKIFTLEVPAWDYYFRDFPAPN